MRQFLNYVAKIFKDQHGEPSSKRWFSFIVLLFLIFLITKITSFLFDFQVLEGGIPEIGTNIAWLLMSAMGFLVLLLMVLMGYASLAEKMLSILESRFGSGSKTYPQDTHLESRAEEFHNDELKKGYACTECRDGKLPCTCNSMDS